jgi:3-hydroxyisobutyrate dehydrogenase-like beta-hydroxyacid dehydrogenase
MINKQAGTSSSVSKEAAKLRVGVIGLGMIGGGIAQCYARHNWPLSVYDIRPDASAGLPGVPPVLESPAEVARRSDVIIVAVVDADQVRTVLNGPAGVFAGAQPGAAVLIASTIAVSVIREIAEAAKKHGLIDSIRPTLAPFSPLVQRMGPTGAGMAAKIARNVITYSVWQVVYEAGLLAETAGVDLPKLIEAVRASDPQGHLATQFLLRRGTVAPIAQEDVAELGRANYVSKLMRKDLEAALALADELGVDLSIAPIALAGMEVMLGLGKAS